EASSRRRCRRGPVVFHAARRGGAARHRPLCRRWSGHQPVPRHHVPRLPHQRRRHRLRGPGLAWLGFRQRPPRRGRGQLPRKRDRPHRGSRPGRRGRHQRLCPAVRGDGQRPVRLRPVLLRHPAGRVHAVHRRRRRLCLDRHQERAAERRRQRLPPGRLRRQPRVPRHPGSRVGLQRRRPRPFAHQRGSVLRDGQPDPQSGPHLRPGAVGRARLLEAGKQQHLRPARHTLRVARAPSGRHRSARAGGPAARRRAHLPGVLRLEPRGPYLAGAGDRRGSRPERPARVLHPHRGGGPRGPVRHAAVQPTAVAAARGGRGIRAGGPWHLARGDRRHGLRREPAAGPDRRRRARAAEPPRRDRAAV
ncbi:MAG: Outer membrane protein A precursor, partial [uncultured Acetobacteraceae bacterium]